MGASTARALPKLDQERKVGVCFCSGLIKLVVGDLLTLADGPEFGLPAGRTWPNNKHLQSIRLDTPIRTLHTYRYLPSRNMMDSYAPCAFVPCNRPAHGYLHMWRRAHPPARQGWKAEELEPNRPYATAACSSSGAPCLDLIAVQAV
ncbi:hypothetical protein LX36DRAFT_142213 [Colletotrichum falcatum]|nr:hypothetical protein LX36DRAFT_142213 [Colletotrichum falcatum]